MVILLVRHGETPGNATRVIQLPDTPLSERGLAQARRLATRLAERKIGAILSSDLARARMTAECVRDATGAPLAFDAGLQERNFGDLRGTPYAALDADPFRPGYTPPGGESWDALHARADAVWKRIVAAAARAPGDLVVVSHGLLCFSLVSRLVTLPEGLDPPIGFGNTALTEIDPEPPWRVGRINCTAHLDAATAHDVRTRSGL